MKIRSVVTLVGLALLVPIANAQVANPLRETSTLLTFDSSANPQTFVGARYDYLNELFPTASSVGDSFTYRWNILSGHENLAIFPTTSGADLSFTGPTFDPALGVFLSDVTVTFNDPNDLDFSYFVGYGGVAVDGQPSGGTESFIARTQVERDGLLYWALVFNGGGGNFPDNGGTFNSSVVLPGFWDPSATGPGSVEWSFNSAFYNIGDFFTYDPGADTTTFSVFTNDYVIIDPETRAGENPRISLTLIGSVVPTPGTAGLFALVGIAATRRRR